MVVNNDSKTLQPKERFQIVRTIADVMDVPIRSLVLVILFGIDGVVIGTSSMEVEVPEVEGNSSLSMVLGIGLYHNADQMAEIPIPTQDGVLPRLHEVELEEVCYLAPTGKPVAVSAVTSGVYGYPLLLLGMVVSSAQVSGPMGLPPPIHAPILRDPQGTIVEVLIGFMQVVVRVGMQIVESAMDA